MHLFYLDSDSRLSGKSVLIRNSKNCEHTRGSVSTEIDDCMSEKLQCCAEKRASGTQAISVHFEVNATRRKVSGQKSVEGKSKAQVIGTRGLKKVNCIAQVFGIKDQKEEKIRRTFLEPKGGEKTIKRRSLLG